MAKVHIKNENKTVEIPDGSSLVELDGKCGVLFACKAGSCGSCKVKVLEGMENLEPPNETEKVGLSTFGSDPKERLLCMCKIKGGEITIEY